MRSLQLLLSAATALLAALPIVDAGRFADLNYGHYVRKQVAFNDAGEAHAKSFRYLNNKTSQYQVKSLPDVPFDLGEMYSGLMPIDESDPSRALFFVWQPKLGKPVDEVTIWLNGGPGCSSLGGFFQENGRFLWPPGVNKPYINQYSWVNLTNMLWVEQPVGTGFSIGKVTAKTQEETAQDFIKFFKNFQKTFGIKNYKIYVTGESYAGRYVPYISAAMLNEKNKKYYDLSGAIVYDPVIGQFDYTQMQVTMVPFVNANKNLFSFDTNILNTMNKLHKQCGYQKVLDKYLKFPPPGHQPAVFFNASADPQCDLFDFAFGQSLKRNPCFNIYEVTTSCPLVSDVLSFPTELFVESYPTYFNRKDVKKAFNAPLDVTWQICSANPVYKGGPKINGRYQGGPESEGDLSADPIQKVLPQVIEATNRVLVSNGDYDMIIQTQGTLLAIQNMTWHGKTGFQKEPSQKFRVKLADLQYADIFSANGLGFFNTIGQGNMGVKHYERGLQWVQSYQAGHMQPTFQPRATYLHVEWMLGRIDKL